MQLIDQYIAYFKYLAEQHPLLQHSDEVGKRVFEVISVEEAIGDFRTSGVEKGFVMRLIIPTYSIGGQEGSEDSFKKPQGGFITAKYYDKRNGGSKAFLESLKEAEQVNDELIERMFHDSREGHPLWNYSLNSDQQINVQSRINAVDPSYAGWLTTFNYNQYWRNCITAPGAPAWADGGQTPHTL